MFKGLKKIYLNLTSFLNDGIWIIKNYKSKNLITVCVDNVTQTVEILDKLDYYHFNKCKNHYDKIIVREGFFEKTKYLRFHLKELLFWLKPNAELEINYKLSYNSYLGGQLIRPFSFFMYEVSNAINNYVIVEEVKRNRHTATVRLTKKELNGKYFDIHEWSFGIISNGSDTSIKNIQRIINEIQELQIPSYEIIVCGPSSMQKKINNCILISDDDLVEYCRPPITIKKNRLIRSAKYENIALMHDRIFFSNNWYNNIANETNGKFEFVCTKILDDDTKKMEILDWQSFHGSLSSFSDSFGVKLSKDKWNEDVYIDGGLIIGKKFIMQNNLLNENLFWGEAEDLHYSKQLNLNGVMIKPLKTVVNYSQTHRNKPTITTKLKSFTKHAK